MQTPASMLRPLVQADMDSVVEIDAEVQGHSRRTYFDARLAAARRRPDLHAQFAATDAGGLTGHILARVLDGEFGRAEPRLQVDALGVRRERRRSGVGRQLFAALVGWAQQRGIRTVQTEAEWNNHTMLGWLDAAGFSLAPAQVLGRAVAGGVEAAEPAPEDRAAGHEVDYSPRASSDFEHLARDDADVRTMVATDLADIVRVDRAIIGYPRERVMAQLLDEALADSTIRVSLTARVDGAIVGYLMARADRGDFGRTEAVAVLDTIGVDPGHARTGVGRALLSQLFANLGALRIERVETTVAPRDFALLGFLYAAGFAPSQRLSFVRRIEPKP